MNIKISKLLEILDACRHTDILAGVVEWELSGTEEAISEAKKYLESHRTVGTLFKYKVIIRES